MRFFSCYVAPAAIVVALTAGCTQGDTEPAGPDFEALRVQADTAGKGFRACEVRQMSSECTFAVRDGADAFNDIWYELRDHGLEGTDEAIAVSAFTVDLLRWLDRCDSSDRDEDLAFCVFNAPKEQGARDASEQLEVLAKDLDSP